jgi:hypothetical protein
MIDGYDDEVPTEEELKQMEADDRTRDLPPPDDSDEVAPTDEKKPAAEPDGDPDGDQPEDQADEEEAGDANEELRRFLEKHKGKTPEQLVELAFQQQKRASRAEFTERKTREDLQSVVQRIQAAKDAKAKALEDRRKAFEEKLRDDPDAATREAFEASLKAEEAKAFEALDEQETAARAAAAIELAASCIPDFQQRAPAIRQFGLEMGFQPEEVDGIMDGRQIVTLHLASIAGRMMQAGIIDTTGKFLTLPEPAKEQQQQELPRGTGFNRAPARSAKANRSVEDQLSDILNMKDEDFDKLDEDELNDLLRKAG